MKFFDKFYLDKEQTYIHTFMPTSKVDKITNREIRNILRQMLDDEENEDKSRKSRYVYCIKT